MIKYSFLIPAYNRVKETEDAIKSILNQKNKDYEIIVLDDKSTEDFSFLINKYKEKVKFLKHEKNMGLSSSRNDLVKHASGKYFIFLDNDDVIDEKFLEVVDEYLKSDIDILSFTNDEVKNNEVVKVSHKNPFDENKGINIMTSWILNRVSFDSACFYIYNREFYLKNKFEFEVGKIHEDFGLTPIILSKAKTMISLDKVLYHVILSETSIIRGKNKEKTKRNVYDKLYHYDKLIKYFQKSEFEMKEKEIIYSFLANTMLSCINELYKEDRKEFIHELKTRKVHKYLLADTLKRKIKKEIISLNYKLYKFL